MATSRPADSCARVHFLFDVQEPDKSKASPTDKLLRHILNAYYGQFPTLDSSECISTSTWKPNSTIHLLHTMNERLLDRRHIHTETSPAVKGEPVQAATIPLDTYDVFAIDCWEGTASVHAVGRTMTRRISGSRTVQSCEPCSGSGNLKCSPCSGTGHLQCSKCSGTARIKCGSCSGKGQTRVQTWKEKEKPCWKCSGESLGNLLAGNIEQLGGAIDLCNVCLNKRTIRVKETVYANRRCSGCSGTGALKCTQCRSGTVRCSSCHTTGKIACDPCDATGRVATESYVSSEIQAAYRLNHITENESLDRAASQEAEYVVPARVDSCWATELEAAFFGSPVIAQNARMSEETVHSLQASIAEAIPESEQRSELRASTQLCILLIPSFNVASIDGTADTKERRVITNHLKSIQDESARSRITSLAQAWLDSPYCGLLYRLWTITVVNLIASGKLAPGDSLYESVITWTKDVAGASRDRQTEATQSVSSEERSIIGLIERIPKASMRLSAESVEGAAADRAVAEEPLLAGRRVVHDTRMVHGIWSRITIVWEPVTLCKYSCGDITLRNPDLTMPVNKTFGAYVSTARGCVYRHVSPISMTGTVLQRHISRKLQEHGINEHSKTVPEEMTDLCSVFRSFALHDVHVMQLYKSLLSQLPDGFDAYVERVQEGITSVYWIRCAVAVSIGVLLAIVSGSFWPLVLGSVAGLGCLMFSVMRVQRI